ncbi:hypothetical protein GINT2_001447 [Glugoides intestinalis]
MFEQNNMKETDNIETTIENSQRIIKDGEKSSEMTLNNSSLSAVTNENIAAEVFDNQKMHLEESQNKDGLYRLADVQHIICDCEYACDYICCQEERNANIFVRLEDVKGLGCDCKCHEKYNVDFQDLGFIEPSVDEIKSSESSCIKSFQSSTHSADSQADHLNASKESYKYVDTIVQDVNETRNWLCGLRYVCFE